MSAQSRAGQRIFDGHLNKGMQMSERKEVDVSVFDGDNEYSRSDSDWPPKEPTAFLAWFAGKIALIPLEFAGTAYVELSGGGGGDYDDRHASISIGYKRPETDVEMAKREGETKRYTQESEARERWLYENLKKKFEGQ